MVQDVALGARHTCVLATDSATGASRVLCWGRNDVGQCGAAAGGGVQDPSEVEIVDKVTGLRPDVKGIAAGDNHTCAVTDSGVFCWGDSSCGQLGLEPNWPGKCQTGVAGHKECAALPDRVPGIPIEKGQYGISQALSTRVSSARAARRRAGAMTRTGRRSPRFVPLEAPYVVQSNFLVADRLDEMAVGSYPPAGSGTTARSGAGGAITMVSSAERSSRASRTRPLRRSPRRGPGALEEGAAMRALRNEGAPQ